MKDTDNTAGSRKIMIMGATSGIGLELTRCLAGKGWTVGAAGRRTEALDSLVRSYPGKVIPARINIGDPEASEAMKALAEKMGGMDIYCHLAGTGYDNPSLDPSMEMLTVKTNVEGFTRMTGAAYRWMRDSNSGRGRIAAVTSVAGTDGIGMMASYSASKSYQQAYLRALDQLSRLEHQDIRITDIRPGWIRTPLLDGQTAATMEMTLPYAVKRIARAIIRGKRVAVIDWRWNLLAGLWRLVPHWLWVKLPVRARGLKKSL